MSAVDDWVQRYASALAARLEEDASSPLDGDAAARILRLARVVAHGTERVNAPLASYVAGWYAAARMREGAGAAEAVREATVVAEALLEESPGD